MSTILKSISYIFHPLLMPLFGVVFYFQITRRDYQDEVIWAKLVALFILTVLLPIVLYFLLKTLGKVQSVHLKTPAERIIPLALNCVVTLIVIKRIIPPTQVLELYYFFIGILISSLSCLILALFKFKASIHMIAVSGVFMFFIALSIHFSININGSIALMCLALGAVATSRLHLRAHTPKELIIGAVVGLFPQLILIPYWL